MNSPIAIPIARLLVLLAALAIGPPSRSLAQEDEDDLARDLRPGLRATYQGPDERPLFRIEPTLVMATHDPSLERHVAPGRLSASWRGKLFTIVPGQYRLAAFARGHVRVSVNGEMLLDAETGEPDWLLSEPIRLEYGYHVLEVDFRQTSDQGNISLFWSGPRFGLEPVPARRLFHDQDNGPRESLDRGAALVRGLRCAACHDIAGEPDVLPAPALDRLRGNLDLPWLAPWIASHAHDAPATTAPKSLKRMPHFALRAGDAEAIAAWLWAESKPPAADDKLETDGDAQAGETLFHSLGCLACHRARQLGAVGPLAGGDLSRIGSKRPADFFARWLADPAAIDPNHRMPVFTLTDKERADLGCYLASLRSEPNVPDGAPTDGDHQRLAERRELGHRLVAQHRCDACHKLPGAAEMAQRPTISLDAHSNWKSGCTSETAADADRPHYRLAAGDRAAIAGYVKSLHRRRPANSIALDGGRVIRDHNCLACHARGLSPGIAGHFAQLIQRHPRLAARLPAMSPPALDSVGDKLHEAALKTAITGGAAARRTWLDVRMPKFNLSGGEIRAVVDYLIRHDRIPDRPESTALDHDLDDDTLQVAGARLVTAGGFGCTSCHQIGQTLPIGVALNAHGSDLSQLGSRVRRSWFDRWVRDPARIVPRMEMPSIQQPIRGVLHDRLDEQLAAVWHVLNRPDFNPPRPDPVRVVRARNVPGSDQRASVLTEVLEVDDRVYIKPLLVGLPNRHNVLIDLDSGGWAGWWIGDTARQHTRGKSWVWESAGSHVAIPTSGLVDVFVRIDGNEIPMVRVGQFATELDQLVHVPRGMRIKYRHHFNPHDGSKRPLVIGVTQTITATDESADGGDATGFRRHLKINGLPRGATVALTAWSGGNFRIDDDARTLSLPDGLGSPQIRIVSPASARITTTGDSAKVLLATESNGRAVECELTYTTNVPVDRFPVELPPPEPIEPQSLDVVPGFTAHRLPLPIDIMPTGLAWRRDGALVFSSLEGRVWLARDTDDDGLEDAAGPWSDELPAPYGVATSGDSVDVICKFGLLRLYDNDRDGRVDRTKVLASGWGHTADYHDWAVGLERDESGNYYIALPCRQDDRSAAAARWRGMAARLVPRSPTADDPRQYRVEPFAAGLRFPMGLALSRDGHLLATDNQGNYNPFNELNHLLPGRHYGFFNHVDRPRDATQQPPLTEPAINIPHPWTRSVNGICFLESPVEAQNGNGADLFGPWQGHLVGCEYDTRRLIRMSLQRVGGQLQGACYPLSREPVDNAETLAGPVVCQVAPDGDLYVGNMRDSGWGGGRNTGSIVRLRRAGRLPAGIAEVRATSDGFVIDFTQQVDAAKATNTNMYLVESYRRASTPEYGGEDQDRRIERITAARVSADRRRVALSLENLRRGFVYEIRLQNLAPEGEVFFPAEAYYTMKSLPGDGGNG